MQIKFNIIGVLNAPSCEIDLDLPADKPGVVYLVGENNVGKSSICAAVRAVLSSSNDPLEYGRNRKSYVQSGADVAEARMTVGDSYRRWMPTSGKIDVRAEPPVAHPLASGIQNPMEIRSPTERKSFWQSAFRSSPSPEVIRRVAQSIWHPEVKLEKTPDWHENELLVIETISSADAPKLAKLRDQFKEKVSHARQSFNEATGEKCSWRTSPDFLYEWRPEGWQDHMEEGEDDKIPQVEAKIYTVEEQIRNSETATNIDSGRVEALEQVAMDKKKALATITEESTASIAAGNIQLEKNKREAAEIQSEIEPKSAFQSQTEARKRDLRRQIELNEKALECPHCKARLFLERNMLVEAQGDLSVLHREIKELDETIADTAQKLNIMVANKDGLEATRTALREEMRGFKTAIENAENEFAAAKTILQRTMAAADKKSSAANVERLQSDLDELKDTLALLKKDRDIQKIALAYDIACGAVRLLDPSGEVVLEANRRGIGTLNERLKALTETADLPPVKITEDTFEVFSDGFPAANLGGSWSLRARYAIQIAAAVHFWHEKQMLPAVVLDEVDTLDDDGLSALSKSIYWLKDNVGDHALAVLAMTETETRKAANKFQHKAMVVEL